MKNDLIDENSKNHFLVAGIGASAGGIKALRSFFENVSEDSGIAYVVILHLSPDFESKLAEILQSVCKIPVSQVKKNKVKVRPNHVYVIPPNKSLKMYDGTLALSEILNYEERRAPVDVFFRTLAQSLNASSIAIILSGTGANGSMGIRHIKELGGIVMVQNPNEAEYADMPRNSIGKGIVDFVLPVKEMPEQLIKYRDQVKAFHSIIPEDLGLEEDENEHALLDVFKLLRQKTGYDFSNYKRATLLRRIERRMNVLEIETLREYAKFLKSDPIEPQALLKDLLISVTNFFRDQQVFEALEREVIPKIFLNKTSADTLRIWIAGCATGEEAYSMAMLCKEYAAKISNAPKIQIFASDIDQTALIIARYGRYSNSDVTDIQPERLERFFEKEGDAFRVKQDLRESVLFVQHNLIKDPPFSRIDLISCRNLLIYLNKKAQSYVMNTFHFALNKEGFLVLGTSETTSSASDLYVEINKDFHIYQSRYAPQRLSMHLPLISFPRQEQEFKKVEKMEYKKEGPSRIPQMHHKFLEAYAPPSILLDWDYEVMHVSDNAGKYLRITSGKPSFNILNTINPAINNELQGALYSASQNKKEAHVPNVRLIIDGIKETINLIVRPIITESSENFLLVLFEPQDEAQEISRQKPEILSTMEPLNKQLKEELNRSRERLRSRAQQYEVQTEELKASNEELQAINEELRSAAEELETGKEELQSINEELATVNQELKVKIEELSHVNNNFKNLINSTNIATIFLDRAFTIRFFTPMAKEIFNLIPADYGRSLTDITHRLYETDIIKDAKNVLENLLSIEREVFSVIGNAYKMRISPYRTAEDYIDGVVITFVNISDLKHSEQNLRESYERIIEILESIKDSFYAVDADFNFTYINKKAQELWGKSQKDLLGKNFWEMIPLAMGEDAYQKHKGVVESKKDLTYETYSPCIDKWIEVRVFPNKSGGISCYFQDITERRRREEQIRASEAEFRAIVNQAAAGVAKKSKEGRFIFVNKKFCEITGYEEEELLKMSISDITFHEDLESSLQLFNDMIKNHTPYDVEKRYVKKNGEICWVHNSGTLILDKEEKAKEALTIIVDITEGKLAIEKAIKSEMDLRIALEAAELGVWDWDMENGEVTWNDHMYKLVGLEIEDKIHSLHEFNDIVIPEDLEDVKKEIKAAIKEGKVFEVDFRIKRYDNQEIRWLHCYGKVLRKTSDGKSNRFPGVAFDITKQKLVEKQKDEFIGIASHELKTPVTSIKAYAQLLEALFEQSNDLQSASMLRKLNRQVDRMTLLINDLLDTTKITDGKLQLHLEQFDLNESIIGIKEMMQSTSENHEIELDLKELPLITADKDRIEQVLVNLVGNSIKYAPEGKKIIISSTVEQEKVKVEVRDFGNGLAVDMHKKVFERFFRINDLPSKNYQGVGLGLYICAEIIKKHQGDIWVESKVGKGCRFFFTLPLKN